MRTAGIAVLAGWIGLTFALGLPGSARADVPTTINYQGLALDPNGVPINASVAASFRLFATDTGGAALWSESHPAILVTDGVFDVTLGETTPLTAVQLDSPQLWLEVEIQGETLTPRQRIVAVPYAIRASEAETLLTTCSEGDALRYQGGVWVCASACSLNDTLTCYTGPAGTAGVGPCEVGARTCDASGTFGSCEGETLPSPEVCCDPFDNDCDGTKDEGCAQALGASCGCNAECSSGFCVAGICCDSACTGSCEGCDVSGMCVLHPPGQACNQSVGTCNGVIHDPADVCDGAGTCMVTSPIACSPYLCVVDACGTSCTTTAECAGSGYCDPGTSQCLFRLGIGEACTLDEQCQASLACIANTCQVP